LETKKNKRITFIKAKGVLFKDGTFKRKEKKRINNKINTVGCQFR